MAWSFSYYFWLLAGAIARALLIQFFLGITFAAAWMAGVAYADESAPPGLRATAQGLLGAVTFGVGLAAGGFVGGPLLASFGARALFLVFGLVAACLAVFIVIAGRFVTERRSPLDPVSARSE